MANKGGKVLEISSRCKEVKVHLSICLELQGFVDRVLPIIVATESARPNCALAIEALSKLQITVDIANSVIKHCSESSKLYLAMTSHRILSRCKKIRNAFESYLTQIQSMVPLSLAAEISATLHDLKDTKFSLDFAEFEAREVILALFEKNSADSDSMDAKLEAIQIATSRLEIKSPCSLIVEKEALEKQLDKVNDTNHRDKERLDYLLDLLTQYGKFIQQPQNGNHSLQHEPHHHQSLEHELIVVVDEAICDNQVNDSNDTIVGDFELLST